jgi:hypothetical protein
VFEARLAEARGRIYWTNVSIHTKVSARHDSRRKKKNFLGDLSNTGRLFDYIVKAEQAARPKTKK